MKHRESKGSEARLRVDPTACDGVGICAHLAPSLITMDSWGFPIMDDQPAAGRSLRAARAAVAGCPHRALALVTVSTESTRSG